MKHLNLEKNRNGLVAVLTCSDILNVILQLYWLPALGVGSCLDVAVPLRVTAGCPQLLNAIIVISLATTYL